MEQLLEECVEGVALTQPLTDAPAVDVVERLKQEADRFWFINANRSLELANMIVEIGQARGDLRQIALGVMARGDALKFLGRTEEAWQSLEQAGDLFREADDEVGWARTRIGRLYLSMGLNRVVEALADAKRARDIFTLHDEHEKRLRLDLNTAIVYTWRGDDQRALALYHSALTTAEALGKTGQQYLVQLYINIGLAYDALGDFHQALAYYERARTLSEARQEVRHVAIAETNIAIIAIKQGHYRRALNLLHRAHDIYIAQELLRDAAEVSRIIVECYLLLNRYAEARDLAQEVVTAFRSFGEGYEEAVTLLELATAEAELAHFEAAQAALDAAEPIFVALEARTWVATTRLRRGRIALKQEDSATAQREAIAAAVCFEAGGQRVKYAMATLLQGQALLASGDVSTAVQSGLTALHIAQACSVPALRYSAQLLLGRIAEARGDLARALRCYRAAAATVERVQRELTITLRPGFLEDKGEALRALIGLHLRSGRAEHALEALERAKSQVLLTYLANREQLRWVVDDARSRSLIGELDRLRAEHQWFYRLAHEQSTSAGERALSLSSEQALAEVAVRERRMRAITEQLYLRSGESSSSRRVSMPSLSDVRQRLDADTLLIEYYNDGNAWWAFTLDAHALEVHPLPTTVDVLNRLLAQLQVNIAAALKVGAHTAGTPGLNNLGQRLLQRLYGLLLAPLAQRVRNRGRVVIVPYGVLHYLPFHLLHTGSQYLIEAHEVVILPAMGLATRTAPRRTGGARVLAHSWDGRLPQTLAEAEIVRQLFGGVVCREEAASRAVLQAPPTQILHIAAHGEHRLEQPDLSYIQLADGQLYTDDVLQQDLSYELVTLSGCETGRASVAAGDELIGLGRGFLYAGAGALVASLWQVVDTSAVVLMEQMYRELLSGASKAAALRNAQRAVLATDPHCHPAFWGAFQLVGDASPLSVPTSAIS